MGLLKSVALLAFGATAMYYFDPALGPRRRTALSERLAAAGGRPLPAYEPGPDEQLRNRIQAEMAQWVSAPAAIEVVVHEGHVSLRGAVHDDERDALLAGVLALPGVKRIDNRLKAVEERPSTIADLQRAPVPPSAGDDGGTVH